MLTVCTHDNNCKMVSKCGKLSGTSIFCLFGKVLRLLVAQIVLGSDYSGSVKELLQPVLRNVGLKKSLKKKEERQNDLPSDSFLVVSQGIHLARGPRKA